LKLQGNKHKWFEVVCNIIYDITLNFQEMFQMQNRTHVQLIQFEYIEG
jgi:hypothetical protein